MKKTNKRARDSHRDTFDSNLPWENTVTLLKIEFIHVVLHLHLWQFTSLQQNPVQVYQVLDFKSSQKTLETPLQSPQAR